MKTSSRGFTLIELIVSVAIFSLVMLTVTSAYLALISLDRESRAESALSTNLSFAVESIVRNLRTGTQFGCVRLSTDGVCTNLVYTDAQSDKISYYISITPPYAGQLVETCSGLNCSFSGEVPLTDPSIHFVAGRPGLTFVVNGEADPAIQPYATIILRGTMNIGANKTPAAFTIESSATQRLLDL